METSCMIGTSSYDVNWCNAILSENLEIIHTISKKRGANSIITIGENTARLKFIDSQGLAILPLHLAASHRRVKSIETLLSAGADPELRDQRGRSALHLVLTHWPHVLTSWPKPHSKFHLTMANMQNRAEACLKVLCNHRVDVNAVVEHDSRQTALHLAVQYGALPAVNLLVSHGAIINTIDRSGMSPLHMAAAVLNTAITASLVKLGADVNKVVYQSGNTPLHLATLGAATKPGPTPDTHLSCITELLDHGADPDTVNKAGRTPLHEAFSVVKEGVVDLLLKYGCDINKLTTSGQNCLFLFLNHKPNVRHTALLGKLLNLTYPLTFTNKDGLLPSTLMLPEYFDQRDQLLNLTKQPKRLMDICKIHTYQQYGMSHRENLKQILPERVYDFVFNYWENPSDVKFFREGDPYEETFSSHGYTHYRDL